MEKTVLTKIIKEFEDKYKKDNGWPYVTVFVDGTLDGISLDKDKITYEGDLMKVTGSARIMYLTITDITCLTLIKMTKVSAPGPVKITDDEVITIPSVSDDETTDETESTEYIEPVVEQAFEQDKKGIETNEWTPLEEIRVSEAERRKGVPIVDDESITTSDKVFPLDKENLVLSEPQLKGITDLFGSTTTSRRKKKKVSKKRTTKKKRG